MDYLSMIVAYLPEEMGWEIQRVLDETRQKLGAEHIHVNRDGLFTVVVGEKSTTLRLSRLLDRIGYMGERNKLLERWGEAVAIAQSPTEFRFYTGEDIVEQYRSFYEISGLRSCMTGKSAHLVKLYAVNPDIFQLLVAYRGKTPLVRTLIWNVEGERYRDRLYYSCPTTAEVTREWMESQGIYRIPSDLRVIVSTRGVYEYPYMDTLCYAADVGEDRMVLTGDLNELTEAVRYKLQCTDGERSMIHECPSCGEAIENEDNWDSYEETCVNCVYAGVCDNCGDRVRNGLLRAREPGNTLELCERCHDRLVTYCHRCDEPWMDDTIVIVNERSGEYPYCPECVEEHVEACIECERLWKAEHLEDRLCMYCAEEREEEDDDSA